MFGTPEMMAASPCAFQTSLDKLGPSPGSEPVLVAGSGWGPSAVVPQQGWTWDMSSAAFLTGAIANRSLPQSSCMCPGLET